ncbi:MAG: S41 family peptidase [Bacteroidales bacterium]|nr:S41 family peptidase [Bacteroidales bacterium]MDD3664302.1 S41 family peptidase [Bacteroidales bacterium]
MKKPIKKAYLALYLIAVPFLTFAQGQNFEIGRNTEIFMALMKELNNNYVDEISPGGLTRTALEAMLESLDPYTNYISEADVEEYRFITTGEYGGVGVLTHMKGDTIIISEIHDNSPAAKAGIKTGDRILKVNGENAIGKSDASMALIMKGQPGVEISLTVLSPGKNQIRDISLKRENVKLGSIPTSLMLRKGIGYICLERFTQGAARDVRNALEKLRASDTLTGLIIDLRGNGGGLLNEAVGICNLFVGKGQHIVSTRGRFLARSQEYGTTLDPIAPQLPLVILVDESSASASEIVAGALQDIDRAVVVGQKTYGKGLVQNIIPLPYNAQVKITVAKYYIPSGRCIQAIDYQHRDENGVATKTSTDQIKQFLTRNGRIVKDAGGIEPDMKPDSIPLPGSLAGIVAGQYLFDFVTLYAAHNDIIPPVNEFIPDEQLFEDFRNYLIRQNYPVTPQFEVFQEELLNTISDNKTDSSMVHVFDALISQYKTKVMNDLERSKDFIKNVLKAEIASRYYGNKGKIEASLSNSEDIKLAVEILLDGNAYKNILNGNHPDCLNRKQ